ncbi:hypothetical protein J7I98_03650 [Streptomyces sp. ISL-98]|nr:hypothetical protein [Streptomyces sp. ISL-98]MBT2505004.1 hypothetical protein [Streptomyces sp. ISL-98]
MRLPTDDTLIRRQQDLETALTALADGELRSTPPGSANRQSMTLPPHT